MATILIIDDEEIIRNLLCSALETAGQEVTEVACGREGLELYRHRPSNLVITDILMPEMNGLDMLLKSNRDLRGRRKTCPECRETSRGTANLSTVL